jgi:hypothetical protein
MVSLTRILDHPATRAAGSPAPDLLAATSAAEE